MSPGAFVEHQRVLEVCGLLGGAGGGSGPLSTRAWRDRGTVPFMVFFGVGDDGTAQRVWEGERRLWGTLCFLGCEATCE